MTTINWANGVSGLFSTAADWSGGVVPGAGDTAIISAGGSAPYTVTVSSQVKLAGLQLDQTLATLLVQAKLTSRATLLEAGTLTLARGTLQGTVTQTGGTFLVKSSGGTLNGVTWQGTLDPGFTAAHRQQPGTLTIEKSLTLVGAGGTGPGTATFDGPVVLDGLKTLNNATLGGDGTLTVENSAKLTLGSALVDNVSLSFAGGVQEALVNDGLIASIGGTVLVVGDSGSTLGTVTNDGTMSGNITVAAAEFTNDGLMSATAGQTLELDAGLITDPGAHGRITLASGNLILGGAQTTASLTNFYATQHVSGKGSFGFGVSGTLDNTGNTLDIGKGTIFGTLDGSAAGTLSGGTVVDQGGEPVLTGGGYVYPNFLPFTLADLTYVSASPTLTFANNWALTDVTLTGVSTLDAVSANDGSYVAELLLTGDTLSGVGTLDVNGQLVMDSTTATNANGSLAVDLTSTAVLVTFGADQSLAGFTIDASSGFITLEETSLSAVGFDFHEPSYPEEVLIQSATGTQTWDSSVTASIAGTSMLALVTGTGTLVNDGQISAAGTLLLGNYDNPGTSADLNNAGVIDIAAGGALEVLTGSELANSGTIAVSGGLLSLQAGAFTNTGVVSITDGTLALAGTLDAAQLSSLLAGIDFSDSSLDLQAALKLQGGTLTAGQNGIPSSVMLDGQGTGRLTDGTLLVQTGQTVDVLNNEYLQVTVVNDGTLNLTSGDYSEYGEFADAVTGTGAIDVGGTDTGIFRDVAFDAAVGSGQTIDFVGSAPVELTLGSPTSFAGTLNGFAVGDSLTLGGDTVSSAAFKGDFIVAKLSTGKTISFATSSALTGKLSVYLGNDIIYQSAPGMQDWSAHQSICDETGGRSFQSWNIEGGALSHGDLWAVDLPVPWHSR
jgi:fibronectin-binding autotransporter adhesin